MAFFDSMPDDWHPDLLAPNACVILFRRIYNTSLERPVPVVHALRYSDRRFHESTMDSRDAICQVSCCWREDDMRDWVYPDFRHYAARDPFLLGHRFSSPPTILELLEVARQHGWFTSEFSNEFDHRIVLTDIGIELALTESTFETRVPVRYVDELRRLGERENTWE